MKTQYMHAMALEFQLRKGVTIEVFGYVFSFERELEPKRHSLGSCADLQTLADAYIHVSTSKAITYNIVLVDHTKGRQVEALVAQLKQAEGGGANAV
jgi:hypothetical protein